MPRTLGQPSTNPQTGITPTHTLMARNPSGTGAAAAWGEVALNDPTFIAALKGVLGLTGTTNPDPGTFGPYMASETVAKAATVVGAKRVVSGYSGPLFRLVRASDGATLDVLPASNSDWPDYSAIDTWAGASTPTVDRVYDQISGAAVFTQTTAALRPSFTGLASVSGKRPISLDAMFEGTIKSLKFGAGITLSRLDMGSHMVINPRAGYASRMYWEFNDGASTSYLSLFQNVSYFGSGGNAANSAGKRLKSRVQTIGYATSASAQTFFIEGVKTTSVVRTAQSMNGGGHLGSSLADTSIWSTHDIFSHVFFASAPAEADLMAMDAWAAQAFPLPAVASNRLCYSGSSLNEGWGSTLNQTPLWQAAFDSTWEAYNFGLGGRKLSTEYANRVSGDFSVYDATKAKNVLIIDAPSNDIGSVTFTSQADAEQWADDFLGITNNGRATAVTLPFVTEAKTKGFRVVVPTTIARGAFTAANFREFARLRYNAQLKSAATANGYIVADRAGDARLQTPSNTTYFHTDATHLNTAGYGVMASIDKAAILTA
ncbi:SGNH/GDSL hydrolase family protein [Methylobacterium sp. Leaf117]|uniref:SGNH/GDSL hydrolase family protein n=1 Tax=Methylobacterium sp. Leaf117 TaxID=1736260 RepID=UPI0006F9FD44|nr:SGNH/GDSL hydrolase family protein [Methylobacterium sp. Leaf117]KQP80642.1 hypothetical protein ASF57_17415 [Methylobacterium sp. Leaf117]